jgi:hypothetical protein
MDPGLVTSTPDYVPVITAGALSAFAAAVGATATGVTVSLRTRRRMKRWGAVGAALGLPLARRTSPTSPALSGAYRGRSLEAVLLHGGKARVTARIANPRRLLDRLSSDDAALPPAPWLTAYSRAALGMLPVAGRGWNLEVRGNQLTLTAPCPAPTGDGAGDSRLLRPLLDLTCDLAEGVDAATGAFTAAR